MNGKATQAGGFSVSGSSHLKIRVPAGWAGWGFRIASRAEAHQNTCQAGLFRSSMGFAHRAADATPVLREARRHSRESGISSGS